MEFMLGLENLFEHWEPKEKVQTVPEVSFPDNSILRKLIRKCLLGWF